jgi:hypothetical protein
MTRKKLAAALSWIALLAVGCGTATGGHPATAPSSPQSSPGIAGPGAKCAGAAASGVYSALTRVSVPALDAVQFVSARQGWAVGAAPAKIRGATAANPTTTPEILKYKLFERTSNNPTSDASTV